jgi:hypothetical protein
MEVRSVPVTIIMPFCRKFPASTCSGHSAAAWGAHGSCQVRACCDQADQEKFREWQKQMAVDRSRGHFFKSLYQAPADPDGKLALRDPQACHRTLMWIPL